MTEDALALAIGRRVIAWAKDQGHAGRLEIEAHVDAVGRVRSMARKRREAWTPEAEKGLDLQVVPRTMAGR